MELNNRFCTVIGCMDGRIQLPVNHYLQKRFGAAFVDTITEAGPNLILAEQTSPFLLESILKRLSTSVNAHHSCGIAIVGHHDCAGNPSPPEIQAQHLRKAMAFLRQTYPTIEIIALWVDENWQVHEINEPPQQTDP